MHGKLPRKLKRYATEVQDLPNENRSRYNNLTLKQLKLQVGAMDNFNDVYVQLAPVKPSAQSKIPNHFIPLQSKIHNKRNALKKLPELNNTTHINNGNDHQRFVQNPPLFKSYNPLCVVNRLYQIMKDDMSVSESKSRSDIKYQLENPPHQKSLTSKNQFEEVTAKSVKIYRPPRLLDNELNRLTQQKNFSRRKIYSEEKSRPKGGEKEVELLTFYKPKQVNNIEDKFTDQANQFLI